MKNDLSCEVVRDLLPSYLDGLTAEETRQAVERHLAECDACAQVGRRMAEPDTPGAEEAVREVSYLKAGRRYARTLAAAGIVLTVFLCVGWMTARAYLVGHRVAEAKLIQCAVQVEGNTVALSGNLIDPKEGVAAVDISEEGGTVRIALRAARASAIHKNTFYETYTCEEKPEQVWVENQIVWEKGTDIDARVSEIYQTRHPYIGDMPANGRTINALDAFARIGNYRHELQTTKEPYGWKLIQDGSDYTAEEEQCRREDMTRYAAALIGLIDNLGYVTFEYRVDGIVRECTVTQEDADAFAGTSVKESAQTPSGMQHLLDEIGILSIGTHPLRDYTKKTDGTWVCDGINYRWRIALKGRDSLAVRDGVYVVLTNNADVTWEEVHWSMISSQSTDWLDPGETVIVEIGTE